MPRRNPFAVRDRRMIVIAAFGAAIFVPAAMAIAIAGDREDRPTPAVTPSPPPVVTSTAPPPPPPECFPFQPC